MMPGSRPSSDKEKTPMRKFILSVAFAALGLAASVSGASAASCADRASMCVSNGGSRGVCYGGAYASCKRTCTYVGPFSGRAFGASGDCGKRK